MLTLVIRDLLTQIYRFECPTKADKLTLWSHGNIWLLSEFERQNKEIAWLLFQQLETKHTKPNLYQACNVYRKNKLPWQPTNFYGLRCFIFRAGAWIPFSTILYVKKPSHFHIFAFYSMHSWCTQICHELKAPLDA